MSLHNVLITAVDGGVKVEEKYNNGPYKVVTQGKTPQHISFARRIVKQLISRGYSATEDKTFFTKAD